MNSIRYSYHTRQSRWKHSTILCDFNLNGFEQRIVLTVRTILYCFMHRFNNVLEVFVSLIFSLSLVLITLFFDIIFLFYYYWFWMWMVQRCLPWKVKWILVHKWYLDNMNNIRKVQNTVWLLVSKQLLLMCDLGSIKFSKVTIFQFSKH